MWLKLDSFVRFASLPAGRQGAPLLRRRRGNLLIKSFGNELEIAAPRSNRFTMRGSQIVWVNKKEPFAGPFLFGVIVIVHRVLSV